MTIEDQQLTDAIYDFQSRIISLDNLDTRIKKAKLFHLFTLLVVNVSDRSGVQFTSLFARLNYIISIHQISFKEAYLLHSYRKMGQSKDHDDVVDLGSLSMDILMSNAFNEIRDLSAVSGFYTALTKNRNNEVKTFVRLLRVDLLFIDTNLKRIQAQLQDEPFDHITIVYNRADRNEDFTELFELIAKHALLPLTVHLIDTEIDHENVYCPSVIVFEPDYLYDVTAISECFGPFANHQTSYLLRKFLKRASSKAILVGNISNYFLDQLIYRPNGNFEDFIKKIFALDPLAIALLSDSEVREMIVLLENHFNHIKDVVLSKFPNVGIDIDKCQIEPSFYSAKYGIQGRLDLFEKKEQSAFIVELKSGSCFRPNKFGLANNHYHQTLLYDMLIESVYGTKIKRSNFILYSKENANHLRFAPALRVEQREAIKERNLLYIHDRLLGEKEDFVDYYETYYKKYNRYIKGFQRKDFDQFIKVFSALGALEKTYCNQLFRFSLCELSLNKLGYDNSEKSQGLSALWRHEVDYKKEQFNILNDLEIIENNSDQEIPLLQLRKTEMSADLSNFRVGDLGVFYPAEEATTILEHQVFKSTIIALNDTDIVIRLRSRQEHPYIFDRYKKWHVEHDHLENGYYDMSRSIYEFAQAPSRFRSLIMGHTMPDQYEVPSIGCSHHLTDEQEQIFEEVVSAKDYYLLWGPPGTGKTSVMLREIAHHFITHEHDRIIFLAYTNRAVDEICDALCSLEPKPSFVRIGSHYSTAERFHKYLLNEQIADIANRKDLREKLIGEQVYVGTVASVVGKVSLFDLIKFDVAIVDEASQILETSLIGLLSRVHKFILIGDHLQLPAVVKQSSDLSAVASPDLLALGFDNFRTSLFERMYTRAVSQEWDHAIGQLTYQGRMHIDIMSFVNKAFYNGELKALSKIERLTDRDTYGLSPMTGRLLFIKSTLDRNAESIKINMNEAQLVGRAVQLSIRYLTSINKNLTSDSIGVITPFRAQIAAIRKHLNTLDLNINIDLITIDTVERYQGGARDIIIMSCCMNYIFQLNSLVSLSTSGVDRKLNVAITRAREQFVLIGNDDLLLQSDGYKQLIQSCREVRLV